VFEARTWAGLPGKQEKVKNEMLKKIVGYFLSVASVYLLTISMMNAVLSIINNFTLSVI
jgi:hypothetical protein